MTARVSLTQVFYARCPSGHNSPYFRAQGPAQNSRSITKIGRRVLHDTCYIAHQFQGQRPRSQAHIVCTSHLCLLLIRETKCTCIIRGGRGHTVSAEPGNHTSCFWKKDQVFNPNLINKDNNKSEFNYIARFVKEPQTRCVC